MSGMKITIAVPCYNSMKYLEQCIASVLNQDYDDYVVWAYDNVLTAKDMANLIKKYVNEDLTDIKVENIHTFIE